MTKLPLLLSVYFLKAAAAQAGAGFRGKNENARGGRESKKAIIVNYKAATGTKQNDQGSVEPVSPVSYAAHILFFCIFFSINFTGDKVGWMKMESLQLLCQAPDHTSPQTFCFSFG